MRYIIYSAVCTPCRYRASLETIKRFVKERKDTLEIRNTAWSVKNKQDAETIGQTLPFIYNADTKLSTELLGVTYETLERTRGL